MLKKFAIAFLVLAGTAHAQTFTGTLDGYYAGNFNDATGRKNAGRAFDFRNNEFSLNYAELAIEEKAEKGKTIGYRFDLGFGDAAKVVNSSEPSTSPFLEYVQHANLSAGHDKLTVDFGKFVTPLGLEVIETKDNWNYSRGLLFTNIVPFYHFGVRATIAANDKVSVGASVTNGWNNVQENNDSKTVGFMATIKPSSKVSWTTNYMVGREFDGGEMRHTFDTYATVDLGDRFSVAGNYDYVKDHTFATEHQQGIALYAKVKAAKKVVLSPRWEWFEGTSDKIQDFTITAMFPVHEQLSVYGEYRHDWANHSIFPDGDSAFGDKQDTVTIGVVLNFTKTR